MEKNEHYFLIVDKNGNVAKIDWEIFSKFQLYCLDCNEEGFKILLNQRELKKPIIKDINKIISDYVHGKI